MTTATAPKPPTATTEKVPLSKIQVVQNHRIKALETEEATTALAEAMKVQGLMQPIGLNKVGAKYYVRFGHRRLAAAKRLKWPAIDAKVYKTDKPMDVDSLAMQASENTNRLEIHPLEEMRAVTAMVEMLEEKAPQHEKIKDDMPAEESHALLVQAQEWAHAEAAKRLGRNVTWVKDRAFLSRLAPKVQNLLMANRLSIEAAREIATLADATRQMEVANHVAFNPDGTGGVRIDRVRDLVARFTASLRGVPWKMEVAFGGLPACTMCPHNSANAPGLFGEKREAMCALRTCYQQKRTKANAAAKSAGARTVTALTVKGKAPKRVNSIPAEIKVAPYIKPGAAVAAAQVVLGQRSAKKARPASRSQDRHDWQREQVKNTAEQAWAKAAEKMLEETVGKAMTEAPGRLPVVYMIAAVVGLDDELLSGNKIRKGDGDPKTVWESLRKAGKANNDSAIINWLEKRFKGTGWNMWQMARNPKMAAALAKELGIEVPDLGDREKAIKDALAKYDAEKKGKPASKDADAGEEGDDE